MSALPLGSIETASPTNLRLRRTILVACCVSSVAKLLEPPLWVFYPPGVQPFDASWNNFRILASLNGVLLLAFLLFGGVLGDLRGRRRLWLIGLAGFVVSNLLLMISPNPVWHVTWRFGALAFGSLFVPLVLATLNITFPDRSRAMAFAIYTAVNAAAVQVAWLQGQYLLEWFGWRAAYVLPVVVALVGFYYAYRYVPETLSGRQRQFDILVYSGWTLLVLAVIYGIAVLPVASDFWMAVVGAALLVGLTGLILVFGRNLRRPQDALRIRSFHARDLTALIVTGAVIQFLLVGFALRTLNYFQVVRTMPAIVAAIGLAPVLLGLLIALYLFLREMQQYQARAVIAGGLAVMAVAIGWMAFLANTAPYLLITLPLVLFGIGYLVASTVWTSAFLRTAVARHFGVNAAISSATSQIGGAVGSALTGNLLARLGLELYVQRLTEADVNVVQALESLIAFKTLLLSDPADIAAVTDYLRFDLVAGYMEAYVSAYSQVLWLMVVLSLVTAVIIRMGLRRSLKATVIQPGEEEPLMA